MFTSISVEKWLTYHTAQLRDGAHSISSTVPGPFTGIDPLVATDASAVAGPPTIASPLTTMGPSIVAVPQAAATQPNVNPTVQTPHTVNSEVCITLTYLY